MSLTLQFQDELDEITAKELSQLVAAQNAINRRTYIDLAPAIRAHCVVFHDIVQSLPNATETILLFNRTDIDPQSMHKVAVGVNYYVSVKETGFYQVVVRVTFSVGAGDRYILITRNGASVSTVQVPACALISTVIICTHHGNFDEGDTIAALAFQNSGGALNAGNTTRYASNELVVSQLF